MSFRIYKTCILVRNHKLPSWYHTSWERIQPPQHHDSGSLWEARSLVLKPKRLLPDCSSLCSEHFVFLICHLGFAAGTEKCLKSHTRLHPTARSSCSSWMELLIHWLRSLTRTPPQMPMKKQPRLLPCPAQGRLTHTLPCYWTRSQREKWVDKDITQDFWDQLLRHLKWVAVSQHYCNGSTQTWQTMCCVIL